MTDEEKKAIKKIDIIVKECELKFKTLGYECDLYDEDEPIPVNEYRTLLNLIEKQQKALENSIPKDSIREKIEEDTTNPQILVTKRGVGYYIAKPE